MLIVEAVLYGLLAYAVCGVGITITTSESTNKEIKTIKEIKCRSIADKQCKRKLYIDEEIKRITKFDIRNWIPKNNIQDYIMFFDRKEADKFVKKVYGSWVDNLINKYTENENDYELNPYKALQDYAGNAYQLLNPYLRINEMENEYLRDMNKNIGVAFSSVPKISKDIIVFRRIDLDECSSDSREFYYSLKDGDVIREKAYMSTSLFVDCAISIHGGKVDSTYALLIIKVPKDENCIFMGEMYNYNEYEMLIDKNKTLEVEKILVKNDKQVVLLCSL